MNGGIDVQSMRHPIIHNLPRDFLKIDQLVILVGGGSILANPEKSQTLEGASKVVCPEYCQVFLCCSRLLVRLFTQTSRTNNYFLFFIIVITCETYRVEFARQIFLI